ncbi:hypothetical protein [Glacieibacterium frigidum]|uniref:Uncharacterized protein n=1 Tax=Glacieibacterium frigidum TaxID=2593303 RepID=A0A552U971_9SPHN|nr:hypothetical protein [Glacieibacterium frigidum]TRW14758.1 hypothetical protein FMM06_13840 [Glacieibacterium frigidum]
MATLARFNIEAQDDEQFLLRIEGDDGNTVELTATYDQLDLIAEAIEEHLDEDFEDADVVEE